jgi:transcription initiation factor IIE alpha subunit
MADDATRAARVLRILGHPLAFRIVKALGRRRLRPSELAVKLGAGVTTVANQLRYLRLLGVVLFHSTGVRRAGRRTDYWLADTDVLKVLDWAERREV